MPLPEITIIGTGRLGKALAKSLHARGIPIKSIFNRSERKANRLASTVGSDTWGSFPTHQDQLGRLIFITVSDGSIAEAAERLATLNIDYKGYTAVHCSGNEPAELLEPLGDRGADLVSFHPLQTFAEQAGNDIFQGIYFSLQGDRDAFSLLETIAERLGAHILEVNKKQKSHLHVSAVFAANYLNALIDASVEVSEISGLSETQVKEALMPLIATSLENMKSSSFEEALTGPIKRGDIATVEKHLELLKDYFGLRRVYCALGQQAVKIAERAGSIDTTTAEKLRELFSGPDI